MLIVDSHLDLAYSALEWNRDLLEPIARIREGEAGMGEKGRGLNLVNFEELRRGELGLFFVTVHSRLASMGKRFPGVRTQDQAYARCMGELAYYRRMESRGVLRQIRDRRGLDTHLEEWERDSAFDDWMLSPLWDPEAQDNSGITLETVVDHIDHVGQVAGNAAHAAIMHGNWIGLLRRSWV